MTYFLQLQLHLNNLSHQKNHVHTDERRPKMHLPPEFIHPSARRFWKPKIESREDGENRSRRHDVVKMRDYVIGVVQIKIGGTKSERDSGQAADAKHRQKCRRKEHGDVEPNRATPE